MSCKAGNKKHKERCQRYKQEGRKEKNKTKKQIKHEKRLKKFADRREQGKTYEYKPNPYKKGSDQFLLEENRRREKNRSKKPELQYWESVYNSMCRRVNKERAAQKAKEAKQSKNDE